MKHLLKCTLCNDYTLKENCPKCNTKTIMPRPPKYSPPDLYGNYRRKAKEEQLKKEGLI